MTEFARPAQQLAEDFAAASPVRIVEHERDFRFAVEMEVAGLYGVCAELGARGLGILTVSDQIRTGEHLSSDDRQTSFDTMVEIALETAVADRAH